MLPLEHNLLTHTGSIKATSGATDLEVILNCFNTNAKISQGEMKLVAIMIEQFTQGQRDMISISLKTLAKYLGKKNIKKAREAFKEELDNIRNIRLKVDGKLYINADLCQTAIIKNGIVYFEFNNLIKCYLLKCKPMPINMKLFQIPCNQQNNPHVWGVGYKILVQAKLNQYKKENKNHVFPISVNTLLKTCYASGLPSYKSVMNKTRHVTKLIIDPIEHALETLLDKGVINNWHYEFKGGEIVNDYYEIPNEDNAKENYAIAKDKVYNEWVKRNVIITMPDNYINEIANYSKKKIRKKVKLVKSIMVRKTDLLK